MTFSTSAGRRLLLQRLGQLARARLHLLEQAHVLDGDHRLVGEGLRQARSACRVNGPDFGTRQCEARRSAHLRASAARTAIGRDSRRVCATSRNVVFRILEHIRNMHDVLLERRAADPDAAPGAIGCASLE